MLMLASASAEAAAASKSDSSVPTFSDDMEAIEGVTLRAQQQLPPARPRTLMDDEMTEGTRETINVASRNY